VGCDQLIQRQLPSHREVHISRYVIARPQAASGVSRKDRISHKAPDLDTKRWTQRRDAQNHRRAAGAGGVVALEGSADYNSNKVAIRGFSRTAARKWGKYRINMNVICPSALTPAMIAYGMAFPDKIDEMTK
jgi:NAD(P)-dependent dehydrogenase (short-subunit alcohol dehydrogenase family)